MTDVNNTNDHSFTRYVALISGLGFGNESQDLLSLQMFSDLVTGELGSIQVTFLRAARMWTCVDQLIYHCS